VIAWATANPWACLLIGACVLVTVRWLWQELKDFVWADKTDAGDGEEAGV